MPHSIRYAESGPHQIAYEVFGEDALDVVFAFGWGSNIELVWENPQTERFLRRFTRYARLILFDTRGVGLSDPGDGASPLEDWSDDLEAVMDAAGSGQAALVGHDHAGQQCMMFAATHPHRARALVTINSWARATREADYPAGMPPGARATWLEGLARTWGTPDPLHLQVLAPEIADDETAREWWARMERSAGTPRRASAKQRAIFEIDVRHVLPAISIPTLVLQSRHNLFVRPEHGRYLAEHIAGARYVELPGGGHWPWASSDAEELMDEVEEFLTGSRSSGDRDRILSTVAFVDIVGSTQLAAARGDRRWRELLETYLSVARREIEAARGRVVKSLGDGVLATFDGPARAVRAAAAVRRGAESLGLRVRAGIHTGEIDLLGEDVGGIAVHIAARLAELADPNDLLVSSTVKDLVAGSGIEFEDRGLRTLKGVPDHWKVFAAGGV